MKIKDGGLHKNAKSGYIRFQIQRAVRYQDQRVASESCRERKHKILMINRIHQPLGGSTHNKINVAFRTPQQIGCVDLSTPRSQYHIHPSQARAGRARATHAGVTAGTQTSILSHLLLFQSNPKPDQSQTRSNSSRDRNDFPACLKKTTECYRSSGLCGALKGADYPKPTGDFFSAVLKKLHFVHRDQLDEKKKS